MKTEIERTVQYVDYNDLKDGDYVRVQCNGATRDIEPDEIYIVLKNSDYYVNKVNKQTLFCINPSRGKIVDGAISIYEHFASALIYEVLPRDTRITITLE